MTTPTRIPTEARYAALDASAGAALSKMSEKEKAFAGLPYAAMADPDLIKAHNQARRLCRAFNNSEVPEDGEGGMGKVRRELIAKLLGVELDKMDQGVFVEPPFWCDYGTNIKLEGAFYCNFNTTILDCALVTIGDGVLFGPNVHLYGGTHTTALPERLAGLERALPIAIGRDTWVGGNCTIVAGVTIGRGCTIGAGSTVTRDIPDWSVVVGTPAKVIRSLTEAERGLKPEEAKEAATKPAEKGGEAGV